MNPVPFFLTDCLSHKKIVELVSAAVQFDSDIYIEKNRARYNAKSFINMCRINGLKGEIFLFAVGADCSTALEKLYNLLQSKE